MGQSTNKELAYRAIHDIREVLNFTSLSCANAEIRIMEESSSENIDRIKLKIHNIGLSVNEIPVHINLLENIIYKSDFW